MINISQAPPIGSPGPGPGPGRGGDTANKAAQGAAASPHKADAATASQTYLKVQWDIMEAFFKQF